MSHVSMLQDKIDIVPFFAFRFEINFFWLVNNYCLYLGSHDLAIALRFVLWFSDMFSINVLF
jgi:hypothetical protein